MMQIIKLYDEKKKEYIYDEIAFTGENNVGIFLIDLTDKDSFPANVIVVILKKKGE